MEAIMRISIREGEECNNEAVIMDSTRLNQVFNTLRRAETSRVYTYEDVQFWRANDAFVMSFRGESFIVGNSLTPEEFRILLLEQKAS